MDQPLTVIICTHNPRPEYLRETLDALRAQTVPVSQWNLLIVDNGSKDPLTNSIDLAWHPSARIVREEQLGVARARHRAFTEAQAMRAGTILFVDDDNILEPDYLERSAEVSNAWPQLGCWGGQLLPRYAIEPPAWTKNYLNYLAVFPLETDLWCNSVHSYSMVPPTAGCFLRAPVWRRYLTLIEQDPRRLDLTRSEDMDLALTSIDLGLGVGRFRDLRLTHIVPATRLTPEYFANLLESTMVGTGMMEYIRYGRIPKPSSRSLIDEMLLRLRLYRLPEPLRTFTRAEMRGRAAARRIVLSWQTTAGQASANNLQPASLGI
jgi:glycosyltransferase involved in cell wall biosynthesis